MSTMSSMSGISKPMSTASSTMSGMTMSMASSAASAAATATKSAMGGMDMGEEDNCKISMLWNWYTIDSCFLSRSWHVTSKAMFAGSCIGVIFLVILLEFLRRMGKEYDRHIINEHQQRFASSSNSTTGSTDETGKSSTGMISRALSSGSGVAGVFRPSILQQTMRAFLHMSAFAVAYIIMLLAMYYNGYIIICIFIGAYLGFFIFGWESVDLGGPQEDTTVCCG